MDVIFFGLCPFHREKSPSFSVSPDKQIFHCFGCHVGGNVIHFIMKIENLGFKEAIEFLAERARIDLPTDDTKIDMAKIAQKEQMYFINSEAGRFFYNNIEHSNIAKEYIAKRHLDKATVIKFGLGFAPDHNSLYQYLISKGFQEKDILATGLVNQSEKGYKNDRFKNRFMFPIFDIRDRVIGFGGRVLNDSLPKYINSPENLIYSKGRHLYGLNVAKRTPMKKIIIVEGYMDAISLHQRGISNVVASLGTALTEQQGRLLRKYSEEVIISYDSDAAGQKATLRGLDILQNLGCNVRVLQMEGAKDPDEYVIKYGPEKFERLVDRSISLVEFKVRLLKKEFNLQDVSEKIKFLNKMAEILAKVTNNMERDVYINQLSKELGVGKEPIYAEIEKLTLKDKKNLKNWDRPVVLIQKPQKVDEATLKIENMIIYLLCEKNQKIYEQIKNNISFEDIFDEKNKDIIHKLYDAYEKGNINSIDILSLFEDEQEISLITEILGREEAISNLSKVVEDVIKNIKLNKLQHRKMELMEALQTVTEENRMELEAELNEIIIQLAKK